MSADKFNFAFEHFEREERPDVLWRVVFRTAVNNPRAMELTRYYSDKYELHTLLTDESKTIISVDKYVAAVSDVGWWNKDQKLAIVNTMPTAAQESPKQGA